MNISLLNNQSNHYWKWLSWYIAIIMILMIACTSIAYATSFGGYYEYKTISHTTGWTGQLSIGRSTTNWGYLEVQSLGVVPETKSASHVAATTSGGSAILHGTLTNLGAASGNVWFEWGYTNAYGNIVGVQAVTAAGDYSFNLTGFDQSQKIFYRFVGQNFEGTVYGSGTTFKLGWDWAMLLWNLLTLIIAMFVLIIGIKLGTSSYSVVVALIAIILGLVAVFFIRSAMMSIF